MERDLVIGGSGGQGVKTVGQLVAYAANEEDKRVLVYTTYSGQQRGGVVYVFATVADEVPGAPVRTRPEAVIAMNRNMLDLYEDRVKPGGWLIINSSVAGRQARRTDVNVLEVPANRLAEEIGEPRAVSMVAVGAALEATKLVSVDSALTAVPDALSGSAKSPRLIDVNRQAVAKGAEYARQVLGARSKA